MTEGMARFFLRTMSATFRDVNPLGAKFTCCIPSESFAGDSLGDLDFQTVEIDRLLVNSIDLSSRNRSYGASKWAPKEVERR
jgi:hypothetical protein